MEAFVLREVPVTWLPMELALPAEPLTWGVAPYPFSSFPRIGLDCTGFFWNSVLWLRWPQCRELNFWFY